MPSPVHVIGGGLAGSEAAWQLARRGVPVVLHEMRPVRGDRCAPDRPAGGAGVLQLVPLRRCDGQRGGPAARGDAAAGLADPGDGRSAQAAGGRGAGGGSGRLRGGGDRGAGGRAAGDAGPREEVAGLPPAEWGLGHRRHGSPHLAGAGRGHPAGRRRGAAGLLRRDRADRARESIDLEIAWFQSRYDKEGPGGGGADYINCPLDRDQYDAFVDALLAARRAEFKDGRRSTPYFEGCLPIEVMAARGPRDAALRADEAGRA